MSTVAQRTGRRVMLRTTDRMLYYVACVEHKQEELVQQQVRRLGFETYLPLLMKAYSNGVVSIRPLLPGYVFARFNVTDIRWRDIQRVQGVTGMLGNPTAVSTLDIRRLMKLSTGEQNAIKPGGLVQLCVGSLEGFRAEVKAVDEKHVNVTMMMFGKTTTHKFRLDEVRRLR